MLRISLRPAHALALGYLSYVLIGTILLRLPISQETPVGWLDNLFIATSAVSTTGLTTVDPATSYNWFGELIIVILVQLGGIGYMTASSFVILAANRRLSAKRLSVLESAFTLPTTIGIPQLLRNIVIFTFASELLGAILLFLCFFSADVPYAAWAAIFHSVSAFCTAGFSLFPTSFETFRGSVPVNLILIVLSYLGGIGFIVYTDIWSKLRQRSHQITFTTQVIIVATLLMSVVGTIVFYELEPSIQNLPTGEKLPIALFQTMSASTTVGFNSVPISQLSLPVVLMLYFLMFFGASPAGTGGGLKLTTLTALMAEVWSHLRNYQRVCLFGREIPGQRVRAASMSATSYGVILGLGIFCLCWAMPQENFEFLAFEAISALGTVGLSMGITAHLNDPAKWVVIILMYVGRIGVITFGLSFVAPKLFESARKDDLVV